MHEKLYSFTQTFRKYSQKHAKHLTESYVCIAQDIKQEVSDSTTSIYKGIIKLWNLCVDREHRDKVK